MSGRLDKIVAMFNALSDSDKEYVLTEINYPDVPDPQPAPDDPGFPPPPSEPMIPEAPEREIETPYETPNASFAERYAP